jgi:hypothetical protein
MQVGTPGAAAGRIPNDSRLLRSAAPVTSRVSDGGTTAKLLWAARGGGKWAPPAFLGLRAARARRGRARAAAPVQGAAGPRAQRHRWPRGIGGALARRRRAGAAPTAGGACPAQTLNSRRAPRTGARPARPAVHPPARRCPAPPRPARLAARGGSSCTRHGRGRGAGPHGRRAGRGGAVRPPSPRATPLGQLRARRANPNAPNSEPPTTRGCTVCWARVSRYRGGRATTGPRARLRAPRAGGQPVPPRARAARALSRAPRLRPGTRPPPPRSACGTRAARRSPSPRARRRPRSRGP